MSSTRASSRELLGVELELLGNAQSDFTGVEIASASPLRSMMRPRCAGSSMLARVARLALLLQEVVVDPLQVERAPGEDREEQREPAEHERRAAARIAGSSRARALARRVATARVALIAAPRPWRSARRSRRAPRAGSLHAQLLARDLLDARRHRPGRLLELQLAELAS